MLEVYVYHFPNHVLISWAYTRHLKSHYETLKFLNLILKKKKQFCSYDGFNLRRKFVVGVTAEPYAFKPDPMFVLHRHLVKSGLAINNPWW